MLTKERNMELENRMNRLENTVNALAFFSIVEMLFIAIIYISLVGKGF